MNSTDPVAAPVSNSIPAPVVNTTSSPHKSGGNGMKAIFTILIVLLLGGLGFVSYQLFLKGTQLQSLQQSQQKTAQADQVVLPKGLVQVSGCLPYMGIHWVKPEDVPHGPYYVTYNGKITAVEYMFRQDEIPGADIATSSGAAVFGYVQKHGFGSLTHPDFPFDLAGVNNIKYMNIQWTPPHAGFLEPHFDLHFYLVSKEETEKICPDAKIEEAQTPLLEQQMQKYNIPYIPVEGPQPAVSASPAVTNPSTTTVNSTVNSTTK